MEFRHKNKSLKSEYIADGSDLQRVALILTWNTSLSFFSVLSQSWYRHKKHFRKSFSHIDYICLTKHCWFCSLNKQFNILTQKCNHNSLAKKPFCCCLCVLVLCVCWTTLYWKMFSNFQSFTAQHSPFRYCLLLISRETDKKNVHVTVILCCL